MKEKPSLSRMESVFSMLYYTYAECDRRTFVACILEDLVEFCDHHKIAFQKEAAEAARRMAECRPKN